ncbi:unnamed protein product [Heterosigma akashiwo]
MELGSGTITFVFVALCCLSAALGFEVTLIRSSCTQNLPYFRELESEGTECYRLFHGATQGAPGLTVDKYGPQLLLQTFREKPDREEIDRIAAAVMQAWAQEDKTLPPLDTVIWRHRGKQVETFVLELGRERELSTDVVGKELGLRYDLSFQLQRRDPLLYLDFRVVRRWLRSQDLAGKSVLNLFAYTCGASVAALAAGAARVASVDFSETALAVGRRNVALNALPADRCEWVAPALPPCGNTPGLPRRPARRRAGAGRWRWAGARPLLVPGRRPGRPVRPRGAGPAHVGHVRLRRGGHPPGLPRAVQAGGAGGAARRAGAGHEPPRGRGRRGVGAGAGALCGQGGEAASLGDDDGARGGLSQPGRTAPLEDRAL